MKEAKKKKNPPKIEKQVLVHVEKNEIIHDLDL